MEPITMGIGLGLSVLGMFQSQKAAKQQKQANMMATKAQMQAEKLREQAMTIDADRRRRDLIRQSIIARSQALTTATSQGAAQGSGLQGAFGQIGGELGFGLVGVNAQEQIGHGLFAANRDLLLAKQMGADAEYQATIGRGLTSLGGTLISNMEPIGRMYNTYAGK